MQTGDTEPGAVVIDVDAELACWQQLEHASTSELVFLFQEWEPAIRVGIHAYLAFPGREFDSIEPTIVAAYQRIRGRSRIPWSRAAPAARRVWQKLRNGEEQAAWEPLQRRSACDAESIRSMKVESPRQIGRPDLKRLPVQV